MDAKLELSIPSEIRNPWSILHRPRAQASQRRPGPRDSMDAGARRKRPRQGSEDRRREPPPTTGPAGSTSVGAGSCRRLFDSLSLSLWTDLAIGGPRDVAELIVQALPARGHLADAIRL